MPVITAAKRGRGLEVILETARSLDAPATVVGQASSLSRTLSVHPTFIGAEKTWPTVAGSKTGKMPVLPLPGAHQQLNAALALATVHVLSSALPVGASALRAGLSQVHWPGRMQLARTPAGQTLLLDGAHNADSAKALAAAFRRQFPTVRPTLIIGVLADKDWRPIAETLAPLAARLLLVPVNSQRTLAPESLQPACRSANPQAAVEVCDSLAEALRRSANEPFLLITGSLYLVGEAMEQLRLAPTPPHDERGLNEWSMDGRT